MIDKVPHRSQAIAQTKTAKVVKKARTEAKQPYDSKSDSLIEQIVSELKLAEKDDLQDIRRELIIKTLTRALGENASGSASFKKLVSQIDNALSENEVATQKLNEIKQSR